MAESEKKAEGASPKGKSAPLKAERIQVLQGAEADRLLERCPGWKRRGKAISRTYTLPGFRAAVAFTNFVAELAEARDHHPDIDIRWNKVTLVLSTHSAGGLTKKDFDLVKLIDGSG